jgi:hypothetical protein
MSSITIKKKLPPLKAKERNLYSSLNHQRQLPRHVFPEFPYILRIIISSHIYTISRVQEHLK